VPSSISELLAPAELDLGGIERWPTAIPCRAPGVYLVSSTADPDTLVASRPCPMSDAAIAELLLARPELTVDRRRPSPGELAGRISTHQRRPGAPPNQAPRLNPHRHRHGRVFGATRFSPATPARRRSHGGINQTEAPVTAITVHGRPVGTVFDLLGRGENDLTYALGWGLATAPELTRVLLADFYGRDVGEPTAISLQQSGGDRGYTDIELLAEHAHVVVEAKRGWVVPTVAQLARYAPRLTSSPNPLLVALTECSPAYAQRRLPESVGGVAVQHRSWSHLVGITDRACRVGRLADRRLVGELGRYLRGVMTMQDLTSNWTYVVALSADTPTGWSISSRDVVLRRSSYFHPYGAGRGWPKIPPNYLAFRWNGHVQQVNHVDGYVVVDDLHEAVEEIPARAITSPHIVYRLGPPVPLTRPLPSGANYRASRLWVALDLLLTSPTLMDALAHTKARTAATSGPPEPAAIPGPVG
jgi:hypothetical protein